LPPELHRLSIRHLVLDGTGAVWFGCQYMGPAAAPNGGFLLSSGHGALTHAGPDQAARMVREPSPDLSWDNHCRAI